MALSISQSLAISYPAVLNKMRSAENQWAETSLMRGLEKYGMIDREALGPTIEAELDYQRNPDAQFLATNLQTHGMTETEVITGASYTPGQISVPMTWSKFAEATNTSEVQKIALVKSLTTNGITSHDDLIEQALFLTSTSGFLGLLTHAPTNGQGSDGGIDSAVYTWWRSQQATYTDDTDIEAAFTTVENACIKGTGSKLGPKLMVSDSATWALFAGTQQAVQRWNDTQNVKAGIKTLFFGNCEYYFSPYGTTTVYFLGNSFKLVVSSTHFRAKGETVPLQNASGFTSEVYSALQSVTTNRSRIGCAHL